jgi:Txe/YoeB family toxin of Txe-Axe toxin-antitoxin module
LEAVSKVGFLEYAWSIFFEKDWLKTKLLVSPRFQFPQLSHDSFGYVNIIPEPVVKANAEGEETVTLMGYHFPADGQGKRQLGSLFRASVLHLGAHVLSSNFQDYEPWKKSKEPRLAKFIITLLEDVKANAYLASRYPDKLVDLAFANTLALKRLRRIDRMVNPATKCMAGLLMRANTGSMEIESRNERVAVTHLGELLDQFKEKAVLSFMDENVKLKDEKTRIADEIYAVIEDGGPITEVPHLPHTEEIGNSSIFSPSYFVDSDITAEENFRKCLEFLGGSLPPSEGGDQTWKKTAETEAVQVLETWKRQKDKEQKMLAQYQDPLTTTRFKSVEIPEQDYSEFLRAKSRCKSEAHRLIESLLVVRDAMDEDPRKLYGVLDLQEVIQVVASKSPRLDVFMLDENTSKSYSWIILLDASRSMKGLKDFALELFVIMADAANELLLDATSWALYAFNDRFLVIKDPRERYNVRVKSRIGGIDFDGLTYMPDALAMAGQIIKARSENLRLITVISDGWPYGYPDINAALSETLNNLQGGSIAVVGIGARSRRMEFLFKSNCTVYTLREMTKRFGNLYMDASRVAAET